MNKKKIYKDIKDKEQINNIKNSNELFVNFISNKEDDEIIYTLKNLGELENENIIDSLLHLLNHNNPKIRHLAIKNLAKYKKISLLDLFMKYGKSDISSAVRRESISAIGKLDKEEAIPILNDFLEFEDPAVCLRAFRELLFINLR